MVILLVGSNNLSAETVYVGDTLRVGVRAEPGSRTPSLTVVTSGTRLEVLERQGSHSYIRTPHGVEGWVKSAYLSNTKPALVKLEDASQRIGELESQIEKLKRVGPGQAIQSDALADTIKRLESERNTLKTQLKHSQAEPSTGNLSLANSVIDLGFIELDPALWFGGLTIFFLCLGFIFGVSWHRNQVTKRLGGLSL